MTVMNQTHQGYATLGFAGGPSVKFRIDPTAISWDFKINTSVTNTVGGRVVQVTGATLSDMIIRGGFGEDRMTTRKVTQNTDPDRATDHAGASWRLHKRFEYHIRKLMEWQRRDSQQHAKMAPPALFTYSPRNWAFHVYIKNFGDPQGGTSTFTPGRFAHEYELTLFVVQEGTTGLKKAGSQGGVVDEARAAAINSYIGRLSDGIGWRPTMYQGNFLDYYGGQGQGDYYDSYIDPARSGHPGADVNDGG
jgi:hypothetical protein